MHFLSNDENNSQKFRRCQFVQNKKIKKSTKASIKTFVFCACMYLPVVAVHFLKTDCLKCHVSANPDCSCLFRLVHVQTDLCLSCHGNEHDKSSCEVCHHLTTISAMLQRYGGLSRLVIAAFLFGEFDHVGQKIIHVKNTFLVHATQHHSILSIPERILEQCQSQLSSCLELYLKQHFDSYHNNQFRFLLQKQRNNFHQHHFAKQYEQNISLTSHLPMKQDQTCIVKLGRKWKALQNHGFGQNDQVIKKNDELEPPYIVEGGIMQLQDSLLTILIPVQTEYQFVNVETKEISKINLRLHASTDGLKHLGSGPFVQTEILLPAQCCPFPTPIAQAYALQNKTNEKCRRNFTIRYMWTLFDQHNLQAWAVDWKNDQKFFSRVFSGDIQNVAWPQILHNHFMRSPSKLSLQDFDHTVWKEASNVLGAKTLQRFQEKMELQRILNLFFLFNQRKIGDILHILSQQKTFDEMIDHLFTLQLGMKPCFIYFYDLAVDMVLGLVSSHNPARAMNQIQEFQTRIKKKGTFPFVDSLELFSQRFRFCLFTEILAEVTVHLFFGGPFFTTTEHFGTMMDHATLHCNHALVQRECQTRRITSAKNMCVALQEDSERNLFYSASILWPEIAELRKQWKQQTMHHTVMKFISNCKRHYEQSQKCETFLSYHHFVEKFANDIFTYSF